jgi:hypothetical protein
MGTIDARLRQGMAGGSRGTTVTEHAGQVLLYIDIILKNNITIHYDIAKELKLKKQDTIARFLRKTIEQNYIKIKNVEIKFDIPKLKKDMESKTSTLMAKTFKK